MAGIIRGFYAYLKSLKYLPKKWMLRQLLLSGLAGLAVFSALFYSILKGGDDVADLFLDFLPFAENHEWLTASLEWVVRIGLWVFTVIIFKYLLLLIVAPIMSQIIPNIEEREGYTFAQRKTNVVYSAGRGVSLASANLSKEIFLTLILLALSLIPGFAIVTTPMIFLMQAYYIGYGNLDVFLESKMSLKESKKFVKKNRGLAIGNGAIFLALLLIPILGVFLAPALGITAATIAGLSVVVRN